MKKLELASNLAVLCAAMLLCYVLVTQYIVKPHTTASNTSSAPHRAEGKTLNIAGVNWSANGRSLVLAISSHCGYCLRSTGFYHKLSDLKTSKHFQTKLIAVLPEDSSSAMNFLQQHEVVVDGVVNAPLADIDVEGTPTLMIVDKSGKVLKEWVGLLDATGEKQVISQLN